MKTEKFLALIQEGALLVVPPRPRIRAALSPR
jgi:hypothetical protein